MGRVEEKKITRPPSEGAECQAWGLDLILQRTHQRDISRGVIMIGLRKLNSFLLACLLSMMQVWENSKKSNQLGVIQAGEDFQKFFFRGEG